MKKKRTIRFTLIELLVVIAIIAILASMLLPALRQAKKKGKAVLCISRLKQISLVVALYSNSYDQYITVSGSPPIWRKRLQRELDPKASIANADIFKRDSIFECPSINYPKLDPRISGYGWNFANIGYYEFPVFNWDPGYLKVGQIKNPSETIFFGDTNDTGSIFTELFIYDPSLGFAAPPSTRHAKGGNMAMGDGHVSHFSQQELLSNLDLWKNK